MPRSNIFEAGTASVAELFDGYLEHPTEGDMCIALALSARPLGAEPRNAIEKSLAALGYGRDACTYATLTPHNSHAAPAGAARQDGVAGAARQDGAAGAARQDDAFEVALDAQALFLLVEGLDPLIVVVADEQAVRALGEAYRTEFPADSAIRVFGRSSVAFRDLAALLETDSGRQKAWRVFKSIPRR